MMRDQCFAPREAVTSATRNPMEHGQDGEVLELEVNPLDAWIGVVLTKTNTISPAYRQKG